MFDAGSPVNHASVDTDARTITFSSAPAGAATANYHYYRRVVMDGYERSRIWAPFGAQFDLEEVPDA